VLTDGELKKIAFGPLLSENNRTGPHKLTPQPKGHRTLLIWGRWGGWV